MLKKIFAGLISIAIFIFAGCEKTQKDESIESVRITDSEGATLHIVFYNAQNVANITLPDNSTVLLNGVEMASGIKYANDEYEYSEWHGNIELKKGDEVIFKVQNEQ
ncbi:MAG: MliC family protein [Campylobacteraceae bacterium]|jgi:membrane-bound inhibitor of C-type lysozyme|nr:MliC family protein [Campylobacteraceae bacterium]